MDPKVKYEHYESLMRYSDALLPALERIVSVAQDVAGEQPLRTAQRAMMQFDFELIQRASEKLKALYSGMEHGRSPEESFVGITGCGFNNLLGPFTYFASDPSSTFMARELTPHILSPFFRLYNDALELGGFGIHITLDGNLGSEASKYHKMAPIPDDNVGLSKVMYGVMFSAFLLGDEKSVVPLNFTARAEGDNGFIEIENAGGFFADHLSGMMEKPELQPTFLNIAFDAGMSVHGTTITVPFKIARMA